MTPSSAAIAIVGRPNVGKSTLFNRLIGSRQAVTAKEAGTTRDRVQHIYNLEGYEVELTDTGGLASGKKDDLEHDMEKQAKIGIEQSDLIVFVVDTIQSLTAEDFEVANLLRRSKKPVILVANKCDNQNIEENMFNIYELGFGEPVLVSAIHKVGIDILEDTMVANLKKLKIKKKTKAKIKAEEESDNLKISIVGRPNAGKSSLLNGFLGEERVIVSDIPGTTRDSTDTVIEYENEEITLTDTAGLRRRGKIEKGIEKFSSLRCKDSIERSDVSVILLDATEPVTAQDLHIIELILKEKKGLIIAVNKVDLSNENEKEYILRKLRRKCDFIPWAPLVFISAKNKKNIFKILDLALEIKASRETEISTSKINSFLKKTTLKHLPAAGKSIAKYFYGNQAGTNPPRFMLFFKNAGKLHFSYRRYIENEMRKEFGFEGTPISLTFRETSTTTKEK
ncbi:ribosome biogenesis GTPase Der [Candidatus Peregrinibacteria bacterium]|jgi:GTPase|nr:ribosome biogenesis GTPase Der [Candidatus Peregrinibacteria bacterium]